MTQTTARNDGARQRRETLILTGIGGAFAVVTIILAIGALVGGQPVWWMYGAAFMACGAMACLFGAFMPPGVGRLARYTCPCAHEADDWFLDPRFSDYSGNAFYHRSDD